MFFYFSRAPRAGRRFWAESGKVSLLEYTRVDTAVRVPLRLYITYQAGPARALLASL